MGKLIKLNLYNTNFILYLLINTIIMFFVLENIGLCLIPKIDAIILSIKNQIFGKQQI